MILDLCHATERLWQAAHCFRPEGSQEASDFVMQRLLRLLEGEAGRVIGGFRQMATKRTLRAMRLNGDWEAFHRHRMNQEQRGLYPYCDLIEQRWKAAA